MGGSGPDRADGPVAGATGALLGWLAGCGARARVAAPGSGRADAPGTAVGVGRADPPGTAADPTPDGEAQLRVWPIGLRPDQETRTGEHALRLRVRYLITVDGTVEATVRLLDRMLLGSLASGAVQVAVEPVGPEMWRAFGLTPRLGLYVDVPARAARPETAPPRARQPLRVDSVALTSLRGRVVGPGEVPIPAIRVVAVGSGAETYTDNRGRFAFHALPGARPTRLLLSGKGLRFEAEVAPPSGEPVTIHCDIEED